MSTRPDPAPAPRARLDDLVAGTTLQFGRFAREIQAERPEEVRPALAEIEQAVADGAWAVVMIAYEAAAGLDPLRDDSRALARTLQRAGNDVRFEEYPHVLHSFLHFGRILDDTTTVLHNAAAFAAHHLN